MKKFLLLTLLSITTFFTYAQVGINILIPDSSAVLQLESDNKGLGLTRLTTTQRDAISNPLKGLTIYNTTDSVIEYWNAECWLKVYQKHCYDCDFNMTIDDPTDTLDRVVSDSVFSTITVNQTNGTQPIDLIFISSLPQGVSVQFDGNPTINQSGSIKIVVKADLCAPIGGNYPVIIQGYCGDAIKFLVYNVYIRPPLQVNIPVNQINYNLQTLNNLPASPAQYVYCSIGNGVEVKSAVNTIPAFTTGTLDPNSLICLNNNGAILGRGGDGGSVTFNGNLFVVGGEAGQKGGDALNLTARTVLLNNGAVYGGGSGGGSVGIAIGTPSIPVIGAIVIGFVYCGGGGSESGKGGVVNAGGINLGLFANGGDATCCVSSIPGAGPVGNFPITIPISIASINITPSAFGGDGAPFGQQGTAGYLDVDLEVCVSIPIIGNICIPIPIPGGILPFYGPQSDLPGFAVRRNNNPLIGVPDGTYSGAQIKGKVGN